MPFRRFADASRLLLQYLQQQIRSGETSERRLARLVGLSQPHMHNVLAGKRGLQPDIADRILDALDLSLEDLASGLLPPRGDAPAPWLAGPIGGGRTYPGVSPQPPSRFFDPGRIEKLEAPFLARVAPEETAMLPTLRPGDDLLLECAWRVRQRPRQNAVYAIDWNGLGHLCRCRLSQGALLTAVESDSPYAPPRRIPIEPGERVPDIVRGEVVWFGRMLSAL